MTCPHGLAERETAAYDGYCPICLADENERLRAALVERSRSYISPPCTISEGAVYVAAEFNRRMNVAARALEDK